jgi:membrane-bound ClpP family serine protease
MPAQPSNSVKMPSIRRALILGALLIAFDAFFLGQGIISLVIGLWLLVIGLPLTFLLKRFLTVRQQRLRNIAIYFGAVVLVFVIVVANARIARVRADMLITAVKAFQAKNQRYPNTLDELVPEFIDGVPLAKYTLALNKFWYGTSEGYTYLFYVKIPPIGRQTYSFNDNKWEYRD